MHKESCKSSEMLEEKLVKEYARVEEVLAGFKEDSVLVSDPSCRIGVSETAEY
jgi:hypothetical protein